LDVALFGGTETGKLGLDDVNPRHEAGELIRALLIRDAGLTAAEPAGSRRQRNGNAR
jgi:hypothetical protein